ncbi:Signal transduction histidine kinase [Ectothiorhodosinus mongolicus]|uniref:histidine kinase n=1 Tax=Ectothiorhodosinus mongolicus TaxID=233100 RepID=A0A1R3VM11_9GAMM|nr:ATP-binding protein [Ectothiorhodosinus mongolicus]ULX57756.1 hypothetical protein CKX93_08900 [Ectothiorhodosinus mongolicus]SIT65619.1 Signal transduction histidine kinase [Ectothiorhodosinus mongolicus]
MWFLETFDQRTLLLASSFGHLVAGGIAILFRRYAPTPILPHWGAGMLLIGLGILCVSLRGIYPDLLTLHVGNSLIILGQGALLTAYLGYFEREHLQKYVIIFSLIGVTAFNLMILVDVPGITVNHRIFLFSILSLAMQLAMFLLLITASRRDSIPARTIAFTHLITASIFLYRAGETLLLSELSLFVITAGNLMLFLIAFLAVIIQTPGLILLLKEDADRELLEREISLKQAQLLEHERKSTEALRLKANQYETISFMARGLAHDFNNLLGVLQMGHGTLNTVKDKKSWDEMHAPLEIMGGALKHAHMLTNGLLSLGSDQKLQLQPVAVCKIFDELRALLQNILGPEIKIQWSSIDTDWVVLSHPGFLLMALLNLALNSRDAMPDGGQLIFRASLYEWDGEIALDVGDLPTGEYVQISACDTGHGFNKRQKAHLFDPLYTTKEQSMGHGLGLFMIRSFIRRTQAGLIAQSTPGQGACFNILLNQANEEPC